MSWRAKIASFFGLAGGHERPNDIKRWPADDIDPIEELARIINEAQERDAQDEGRFDDLARLNAPKPIKAASRPPRHVRRS
jgi:hypothetical protein